MKNELLSEIQTVINYFINSKKDSMDYLLLKRYSHLEEIIKRGELKNNPIKGSTRAYLEAHNDWDNPILNVMNNLEKKIDEMITSR